MLNIKIDTNTGRPGVTLWNILVLATVKLGTNCDDDRLQELANHHLILRQIVRTFGMGKAAQRRLTNLSRQRQFIQTGRLIGN